MGEEEERWRSEWRKKVEKCGKMRKTIKAKELKRGRKVEKGIEIDESDGVK